MIKQVCFNTLKNDIYGSTIINYTSLTVNHRKQRRSCLQAIKHRLNRWIWGKNKCILSRVHKTWSFCNIYFSINLLMGKPKVCCRQILLTRACYSFDCSVLIVTNFSTCWLQFSFSITLWHFIYNIMTRKPTRFNTVNDLSHRHPGRLIILVSNWGRNHLREKRVHCHLCNNLIFKTNILSAKMQRELMNRGVFRLSIAPPS